MGGWMILAWLVSAVPFLVLGNEEPRYYPSLEDADMEMDYGNLTNCTNDYCIPDEDYIERMIDHIYPTFWDWVLITLHGAVFVVGIVGNALVCIAVYRNHTMRTVTNYFIVNLALADLMVLLICLPFSVLWDVTETWFFGMSLCKVVPYLQTVSVSVSIQTLTFISIDRWYAICFPLKFKSTTGRAKAAIIIIWLFALVFDIPDLVVLHTVPAPHIRVETVLFTQCAASWSQKSEAAFTIAKLIFLYVGPLLLMGIAYWQIVRVLWRSDIPGHNLSARASQMSEIPASTAGNPEDQLRPRRKAAKMLVAVVFTFAICYLPVHLQSVLRYTVTLPSNKWTIASSLIAHWLCYFNSAVNPLIYNFMSGKFREEFKRTFRCSQAGNYRARGAYFASTSNFPRLRSRTTTKSFQGTSNNNHHHHHHSRHPHHDHHNNNVQRNTEIIPLNAVTTVQHNE